MTTWFVARCAPETARKSPYSAHIPVYLFACIGELCIWVLRPSVLGSDIVSLVDPCDERSRGRAISCQIEAKFLQSIVDRHSRELPQKVHADQ
jgi:hypothetical protein